MENMATLNIEAGVLESLGNMADALGFEGPEAVLSEVVAAWQERDAIPRGPAGVRAALEALEAEVGEAVAEGEGGLVRGDAEAGDAVARWGRDVLVP